jgi:HSP20 family protein
MELVPRIIQMQLWSGQSRECCYDPFGEQRFVGRSTWTPNTDIVETENHVVILMELAGVEKEDVRVMCHEDILQISGTRNRKALPEARCFHRMEIAYGPFEKFFRIPKDLKVEEIQAEFRNGFLEITLPKKRSDELKRIVVVYEEG